MSRKKTYTLLYICLLAIAAHAQTAKLSPWLRHITSPRRAAAAMQPQRPGADRRVCAFVRLGAGGTDALQQHGCRQLARWGSVCIADIPLSQVRPLAADSRICRIEARPGGRLLSDSTAIITNAVRAYTGEGLPQAYTGRGVVMGLMDIGFDLTHPAFYSDDEQHYRISAFWDMLSQDTVGSTLYVGRDFHGTDELLRLGHARDGLDQSHGTGTLQLAAGGSAGTRFRGMAPEADICIVANAVSDDVALIDSADYYKFTFATDALGFKYIFDYAEREGKPCVISFSEGSGQDFWGYDQLYYEILDSLTGPGRLLVVAAGNQGRVKSYFRKPAGTGAMGTFLRNGQREQVLTVKADRHCQLRLVAYADVPDTLVVDTREVLAAPDSLFEASQTHFDVAVEAYANGYDAAETCYDLTVRTQRTVGGTPPLSFEVVGAEADAEVYRVTGSFIEHDDINPALSSGDYSHGILSPGSAPCAICVGATTWRDSVRNVRGEWMKYWLGSGGVRAPFSSLGPTFDGRTKPDVVAPGNNVAQALSSFFYENHPDAGDLNWEAGRVERRGRQYLWCYNSGTSTSAPVVGGALALWLQACPTLSPADVMGVLQRTCRRYDPVMPVPNNEYGYGEIDVYAGLLDVLGLSAIEGLSQQQTPARVVPMADGRWQVVLPRAPRSALTLTVYALTGQPLFSRRWPAGAEALTFSLPRQRSGQVYVVQLSGDDPSAGSTLIRHH